jgi:hypothetical protein
MEFQRKNSVKVPSVQWCGVSSRFISTAAFQRLNSFCRLTPTAAFGYVYSRRLRGLPPEIHAHAATITLHVGSELE